MFGLTSSFVYYNTQVLNSYHSADEIKTMQESYEKKYKKYQAILQPKITDIKYHVDIFPNERNVFSKTIITLENNGNYAIDSLHYSLFSFLDGVGQGVELKKSNWIKKMSIPGSELVYDDKELGYQIFKLNSPLEPNATMEIIVDTEYISKGFENSISNIRVVKNGTFFNSTYILPSFGYEAYNELTSEVDRKQAGL